MPRLHDHKLAVKWTMRSLERGYQNTPDPDIRVWINIDTFDRLWLLSDQYIAVPGDAWDNQPEKFAKAGPLFSRGRADVMPEVGLDAKGIVGFSDGRHRYLWMRENGAEVMPLAVSKSQAKAVRALCGTRRQTSWFIPPRTKVPPVALLAGFALAVVGLVAVARA